MKVLVIGGNGFIGSVVVRTLLIEGYPVRCLLRETSNTERLQGLGYESAKGDVRDPESIAAAAEGCGAIIHLASPSSWDQIGSPLMKEVVIGGTRNVLDVAKRAEARVVFCSSTLAINGSESPRVFNEDTPFCLGATSLLYAKSKHDAERMCRVAAAEGVHVVIVNPGEVYGPNDTGLITAGNLVDFVKSTPVLACHGGSAIAYVDDVALGIVRALERGAPGERYILGGENLTIKELAQKCLRLLGIDRTVVTVPTPVLRFATKVASTLRIPLPYNPNVIPYATRYWFMDSSKSQQDLGITFRSAEETLAPTLEWLAKAGHIPQQTVRRDN